MGTEVTATPKNFPSYEENTTHEERIPKGSIKADGSLILKLYYDPIIYKIEYEPNGGKNDPRNPSTYTVDDKITFQPATREGYNFQGWYEDPEFTKPITGIENRTGDIKVYAKWEAIPKTDTTAQKPIPQTGDFNPIMTFGVIAIIGLAVISGVKYFKLKIK